MLALFCERAMQSGRVAALIVAFMGLLEELMVPTDWETVRKMLDDGHSGDERYFNMPDEYRCTVLILPDSLH